MYTATSTFTDCEHLFPEIQGLIDINRLRDSNFYPRFAQNSSKIQIILKRFNLLVSITFNFKLSFIDFYVHSTPKDQCWHQETSSSQFRQYVHSQEETKLKRIVSKNFTPIGQVTVGTKIPPNGHQVQCAISEQILSSAKKRLFEKLPDSQSIIEEAG